MDYLIGVIWASPLYSISGPLFTATSANHQVIAFTMRTNATHFVIGTHDLEKWNLIADGSTIVTLPGAPLGTHTPFSLDSFLSPYMLRGGTLQ